MKPTHPEPKVCRRGFGRARSGKVGLGMPQCSRGEKGKHSIWARTQQGVGGYTHTHTHTLSLSLLSFQPDMLGSAQLAY